MFDIVSNLDELQLNNYTGAPFTFMAESEQRDEDVLVKVTEAAPFDMVATLSLRAARFPAWQL